MIAELDILKSERDALKAEFNETVKAAMRRKDTCLYIDNSHLLRLLDLNKLKSEMLERERLENERKSNLTDIQLIREEIAELRKGIKRVHNSCNKLR